MRRVRPLLAALATAACSGRPPDVGVADERPLRPGYWEIASAADPSEPVRNFACLEDAEQLSLPALATRIRDQACRQGREGDLRARLPACLKDAVRLTSDATLQGARTRFVLELRTQLQAVRGWPQEGRILARGRWIGACPVAAP